MEIISNVIVGIAVAICLAALIWVVGLENGWFDRKGPSSDGNDPETKNEEESEEKSDV